MDICANRKNGYEAKKVVKKFLEDYPFIRPLIYVLKYFLRQRKLNESFTGGVSSYLLFNLLLSYTQFLLKERPKENLSLGYILVGFFQFYSYDFNFKELGISIRNEGSYFKKGNKFAVKSPISVENFQEEDQDVGKCAYRFNV
jgi:non-canonical poly(A) RNA polymerase PAPD5/7